MESLTYPKDLKTDFRKLDDAVLRKLLVYYRFNIEGNEYDHNTLAALVARQFIANTVVEGDVIDNFTDRQVQPTEKTSEPVKRRRVQEQAHEEKERAKQGEQVAAKVLNGNENGSWILGNVLDYDPLKDVYEIQDEDDTSRTISLSSKEVRRLEDTTAHFRKGDGVLCVFPDTTSFYRATVARNPKPPPHGNSSCMPCWIDCLCDTGSFAHDACLGDLVVRFEDDEDETGVAPPRRVPGTVTVFND